YTGGSLIYNPDSLHLSQLSAGVKIGVRTSKLERQSAELYEVAKVGDADFDTEKTISVTAEGSWSGGASETFSDYIAEKEGSEVFGYMQVVFVDANSIGIVYCYYPTASSALAMQNIVLAVGGQAKLGLSDSVVKYVIPPVARRGFENARWLTFVNSEDTLTACMYSRMPELNGRSSSLYGVNSHNDFIYILGNPNDPLSYYPTTTPTYEHDKISYGDYIIDQKDGKMYAYFGKSPAAASLSLSIADEDNFSSVATAYSYQKYQFPDPENGPKHLFDALPQSVKDKALASVPLSAGSDGDSYIRRLNWILCYKDTLDLIGDYLNKNGNQDAAVIIEDIINDYYETSIETGNWQQGISDGSKNINDFEKAYATYMQAARYFMDEFYDQSPDAFIPAPTLFNIYPDVALDLGGDSINSGYNVSSSILSDWDDLASKSIGNVKNYDEYTAKRDEIDKKFKEFHRLDLAAVNGFKTANLPLVSVNFAFGVKGKVVKNLGIKSGELGIKGLGAAVYLKAEATLQNIKAGEFSFFDAKTREKLQKDLGTIKFSIGPIPCIFKTAIDFDCGWNAKINTNAKYMAGLTALYGGQIDLGAKWGVKFKCKVIPVGGYFKPWPTNKQDISEQAIFVGPASGAPDVSYGFDLGVYVKGSLAPQVGIGVEYISAGVEVKSEVKPEVHIIGDKDCFSAYGTPFHLKGLLGIKVAFGPFFKVTIPLINKKLKTNWTALTIFDKYGDNAITLFDHPIKF
ncbi:MAG: hypothetical protein IK094_08015, partial [Treponema sp.]|nr:hypothetical protein [Treponema sp.]